MEEVRTRKRTFHSSSRSFEIDIFYWLNSKKRKKRKTRNLSKFEIRHRNRNQSQLAMRINPTLIFTECHRAQKILARSLLVEMADCRRGILSYMCVDICQGYLSRTTIYSSGLHRPKKRAERVSWLPATSTCHRWL